MGRWLPLMLVVIMCVACTADESSSGPGRGDGSTGTVALAASMNTDQVVTPQGKQWKPPTRLRDAAGTFRATLTPGAGTLEWSLDYEGMGDPVLRIIDVHLGKRGDFGALVVRLCGPCEGKELRGDVKLKPSVSEDLVSKETWITVVIEDFPNGVIRGQIEPA